MTYKIALVTHYLDSLGGGVTQVVRDLERHLSKSVEVKVFGLHGSDGHSPRPNGVISQRYGLDIKLARKIALWRPDIIHLHGMFTFVSCSSLVSSKRCDVPLVVSPHGMLDPWALMNSPLKKQIFLSFVEKRVLKSAARVHVLNFAEWRALNVIVDDVKKLCIIPNGISKSKADVNTNNGSLLRLLFLGRLHPKKGLSELLYGISSFKRFRPDLTKFLELNIVGWGEVNYVTELKNLAKSLGVLDVVHFRGPAFEDDKERYFAAAHAFILPSFSEGLPVAVLEAWSFGLPVLMTDECNLPEGFESRAAIRIQANPESLAKSIAVILETPRDELRAIGLNGFELVRRKFSWGSVVKQYLHMYDEVLAEHEAKKLSESQV